MLRKVINFISVENESNVTSYFNKSNILNLFYFLNVTIIQSQEERYNFYFSLVL